VLSTAAGRTGVRSARSRSKSGPWVQAGGARTGRAKVWERRASVCVREEWLSCVSDVLSFLLCSA
jgi:hypothetical protein